MRNFVKIDAGEGCLRARLFCMVWCEEEEEGINSGDFQVPISQKLLGRFLSNLICKVMYMVRLKYINLIEIDPIVLELR